jgi:hypothetical protein
MTREPTVTVDFTEKEMLCQSQAFYLAIKCLHHPELFDDVTTLDAVLSLSISNSKTWLGLLEKMQKVCILAGTTEGV